MFLMKKRNQRVYQILHFSFKIMNYLVFVKFRVKYHKYL